MAYEAMVYCTDHNLSDGRVDSSVAGREGAVWSVLLLWRRKRQH